MNAVPQDFLDALAALAEAFGTYECMTGFPAVLVGGAATVIYTAGAFNSGDFDFIVTEDREFGLAMEQHGFIKERRAGRLQFGYYHPHHLNYGFQAVSGDLFDGRADMARLFTIELRPGAAVQLPSIEDMIADRLGQHMVASPTDTSRLEQAKLLFQLAAKIDMNYLTRRVEEEGGEMALLAPVMKEVPGNDAHG